MCLLLSAISIWLYLDVFSLNCPPLLIKHSIDVPSTFSNLYLALPPCILLERCYPSRPHMTRHSPLVGPFRIVLACYLFWQVTLPFPVFFSWIESVFSCHFFLSQALTDQIPEENHTEEKRSRTSNANSDNKVHVFTSMKGGFSKPLVVDPMFRSEIIRYISQHGNQ